ncbi:MAG: hypothetical protein BGO57_08885 [Sphingomonadales bacterium 63-6]|nr:MAG: hypothetical protein BGO57_08885 [Sphingomonadales bacterium 63-6]
METWSSALCRLAGNALLALSLGILLYLGLRYFTEGVADAQYWLAVVLTAPLGLYLGIYLIDGVRAGRLPVGRHAIVRVTQPVRYWLWMIWFGVGVALLFCVWVYAAGKLT